MKAVAAVGAALALLVSACGPAVDEAEEVIAVTSPAFSDGGPIPQEHTCDGEDVPPPLEWEGVPDGAEEIAVVVTDPDAPGGDFVHWVVVGLEPAADGLPDGPGGVEGANDFGELGWAGPCPPSRDDAHTYEFTVHAAGRPLGLAEGASAEDLRAALEDREIAFGRLVGTYDR